ncbi:MAG: hypothetical protein QOG94_893 [Solirubrobacteraceae bacterium]|nr:hypothetical protein [Solirubrobacteraceae bacterium]
MARELEAAGAQLAAPSALAAPAELAPAASLPAASALVGPSALAGPAAPADLTAHAGSAALRDPAALAPGSSDGVQPQAQDAQAAEHAPPPADAGELSGLRLLLDQLDALLRDPTLALALKAFTARLTDGVRRLAAATVAAVRRLRFPRKALLALLALALPLALLALLNSGDDRSTPAAAPRSAAVAGGASLPGVEMPALRRAQVRPKPVRVALVLDRTYAPAKLRRELRSLGTWLAQHHAAGTRVTLIDARSARASASLRPSQLASARASRATPSTTSAIRSALGRPQGRRLLVSVGSAAPTVGGARTLSITPRRGAAIGVPARTGRRSRAAIDDRRPNALAATVARAIMAASGQRERR